MPNVVVIGARSVRQGIGEHVAGWFDRHGARVTGIVGTTPSSVAQAQAALLERYGIDCRGYTDLTAAVAAEPNDIVAICSPHRFHAQHLEVAGRLGVHCLCEKPLWWPAPADGDPIGPFVSAGRRLDVLTQWPFTLPTYFAMHPMEAGAAIERFEMGLSPVSSGPEMIPDAVPHFVSMLRALLGTGTPSNLTAEFVENDPGHLRMACAITHARGGTQTFLHLKTCPERPRPAWYAINGARVDREVELTGYRQFFRAGDRRLPLPDPLGLLVGRFLTDIAESRPTDRSALDHDQGLLTMIYGAVSGR